MPSVMRPVFGSKPVQVRPAPKAVTQFGRPLSIFGFFNKIGSVPKLAETMPSALRSPNALPPARTLMAFVSSVVAGVRRFARADCLRFDRALDAILGIARFRGRRHGPDLTDAETFPPFHSSSVTIGFMG